MSSQRENRKYRRLPIELSIEVNDLFKQDNEVIKEIKKQIEVVDISKTGLGFLCDAKLPIGYYFDAKICLSEKDFFYTVIHIVRVLDENRDQFLHGAEFVGLAPFLSNKIQDYEQKHSNSTQF